MLVLFIRHGETVDNVGGIYAGVRDSELTNHGILQARSLADFLKQSRCPVTRIFASPLQRARRTAEAIRDAQIGKTVTNNNIVRPSVADTEGTILIKTSLIMEQDFGYYEGKPFYARSSDTQKSGKETHHDKHKQDPGFKDVESKESMADRSDRFLDEFLLPAIHGEHDDDVAFAVVAHGIILSHLWRRFLLRLSKKSIIIAPEVTAAKGQIILEHLGGWSNTGVLEVRLTKKFHLGSSSLEDVRFSASVPGESTAHVDHLGGAETATRFTDGRVSPPVLTSTDKVTDPAVARNSVPQASRIVKNLHSYNIAILTVNGQDHLRGVKRARGGIGSAKYDEGQKSLDSFFKKAKK